MKLRPKTIILIALTSAVFFFCFSVLIDISRLGDVRTLAKSTPAATSLMNERAEEYRKKKRTVAVRRIIVPLERMSSRLVTAVLVAEDADFYRHRGVDYDELVRAVKTDWKARAFVLGGSTITQQLAKNIYLYSRKTITRKLSELIYAKEMEARLSKKRILELYLNSIEWGDGIYGCEAAARHYYAVSAGTLTLEQSIRLAAMIINPRRFGPESDAYAVSYRRRVIASSMLAAGHITEDEFSALPFFVPATNASTHL